MRHRSFVCSICSSPSQIRELIDRELSKPIGTRKPLRVLAALGGFSKSGLSRHDRNCLSRARLEAFRDRRKKSNRIGRIILKDSSTNPARWTWRATYDEYFGDPKPFDPRSGFRSDDLFLELCQEPLRPEIVQRAAEIQAQREHAASHKEQAAPIESEEGHDQTEQALPSRDKPR